jgi:hypothetical protein
MLSLMNDAARCFQRSQGLRHIRPPPENLPLWHIGTTPLLDAKRGFMGLGESITRGRGFDSMALSALHEKNFHVVQMNPIQH